MAVDGVGGNGNIDWSVLLNNVSVTQSVDGAQGPNEKANLTLTDADKQILLSLLAPPEIDVPEGLVENPAEKLESLISKLQDGKTFEFTEEQTQVFVATLTTLLQTVNALNPNSTTSESGNAGDAGKAGGVGASNNAGGAHKSSQVLFDLYALMALLEKCAQEQKNAQRDIRSAEVQAQVTSIQNQAAMQKSAALTGLIAGSLICALQLGAAIYSTAKTISNTRQEAHLNQEFGVKDAATELNEAKAEVKTNKAELKTFNEEHNAPLEDEHAQQEVDDQRTQLQQKIEQSSKNVLEKSQQVKNTRAVMVNSEEYMKLQESNAWVKGFSEMSQALGNLGQTLVRGFVDLQQSEAMALSADQKEAENGLEETKELMSSFQDLIEQIMQLAQAILQAENDSMNSAIKA